MITPRSEPSPEIADLVAQREEARARRDFATADSLKARIEAAGWKVVDRGRRSSVVPAAPADVALDGETRYGSAGSVPSRLAEPPDAPYTVVALASEDAARTSRLLAALRAHAPAGTQVVVVVNDPSDRQAAALAPGSPDREPIAGLEVEILRTSARLGYAAALNVALRRAAGEIVILADGSAWPRGDAFTPLARSLADPGVVVAGGFGLDSTAEGRLRPASFEPTDSAEPHALLGAWTAFRRSDLAAVGPLDEHFVIPAWLDVWWSLRLRAGADPSPTEDALPAEGSTAAEGSMSAPAQFEPARSAVRLDLPLESDPIAWPPDRSRLARRNMYRVLDAFGWREDLFE